MKKLIGIIVALIFLFCVFLLIKLNTTRLGGAKVNKVSLANPASVNCQLHGGKLEILEGTGGQYGMCTLPDGTVCEERAYLRKECGQKIAENINNIPENTGNNSVPPSNKPKMCTADYAPVCAKVNIQCIKAPCEPIQQTFSNRCVMENNSLAVFLHDGECTK